MIKKYKKCGHPEFLLGYLNRDGQMDMNMTIRRLACHQQKIFYRAGRESVFEQQYQVWLFKIPIKSKY
jgi:hypothetical protein